MATEVEDPEQQTHFGALTDEPDDDLLPEERLEPKTVVVGGIPVRKGDRKPEQPRASGGEVKSPMIATPLPAPEDEGVLELKRQLSNQQQMTQRAAQIAQAEHQARLQAEQGLTQSNVSMIDQAIESARRDSEQARAFFQQSLDRGDHKGAADAQILISDARANLLRLMEMRESYGAEPQPQRPQPRQAPQPQPQQQFVDPTQQMRANVQNLSSHLAQTGFPKSAEWIRTHPELVKDRAAINAVDGAHSYAVNTLKLIPETDAYFDKIEELLGAEQRETRDMTMTRQGQRERQMGQIRSMGAPARAEAPSLRTGQRRGTPVALTPRQREHARDVLNMTDEEYAAELLDARTRGKMLGAIS